LKARSKVPVLSLRVSGQTADVVRHKLEELAPVSAPPS
jgi:hypothetical protein